MSYNADLRKYTSSYPGIVGGAVVIRGTRIPLRALAERIAYGETLEVLCEDYDYVETKALEFAREWALRNGFLSNPLFGTAAQLKAARASKQR